MYKKSGFSLSKTKEKQLNESYSEVPESPNDHIALQYGDTDIINIQTNTNDQPMTHKDSKMAIKDLSPLPKFDISNTKLTSFEDLKNTPQMNNKTNKFPTFSNKDDFESDGYSSENSGCRQDDSKIHKSLTSSCIGVKVSSTIKKSESTKFKSKAMQNIYAPRNKSLSVVSKSQPHKISSINLKKQLKTDDPSKKAPTTKKINISQKKKLAKETDLGSSVQQLQNPKELVPEFGHDHEADADERPASLLPD